MRPKKCRKINCKIDATYFKPRGIPLVDLIEVQLLEDEIESLSLAHLQELYQEEAALKMNISRQTFGRILNQAHKKIADALINGKALKINF